MSLSVVLHAAEPTKHGVPIVAAIATRHGIKPSAYLYPVSHIERNILRRASSMNIRYVCLPSNITHGMPLEVFSPYCPWEVENKQVGSRSC
jgi:hypothetical protein